MNISTSYDELVRLIREKSGQTIGIRYKDLDTLTLSYDATISLPIINKPVTHTLSADVQLVAFNPPHAELQVKAGAAGNMALDFAAKRLLDKLPAGLVEEFSGGRAVLNLDAVPQLKTFFSRMEIKQWAFYTTSINVEAELK